MTEGGRWVRVREGQGRQEAEVLQSLALKMKGATAKYAGSLEKLAKVRTGFSPEPPKEHSSAILLILIAQDSF